jgi:hypothetical protein
MIGGKEVVSTGDREHQQQAAGSGKLGWHPLILIQRRRLACVVFDPTTTTKWYKWDKCNNTLHTQKNNFLGQAQVLLLVEYVVTRAVQGSRVLYMPSSSLTAPRK